MTHIRIKQQKARRSSADQAQAWSMRSHHHFVQPRSLGVLNFLILRRIEVTANQSMMSVEKSGEASFRLQQAIAIGTEGTTGPQRLDILRQPRLTDRRTSGRVASTLAMAANGRRCHGTLLLVEAPFLYAHRSARKTHKRRFHGKRKRSVDAWQARAAVGPSRSAGRTVPNHPAPRGCLRPTLQTGPEPALRRLESTPAEPAAQCCRTKHFAFTRN